MSTIDIACIPVGPIATNTYVVTQANTDTAFVVDPGMDVEPIMARLAGRDVTHILLTHAHFDHIGGVGAIKEATGAQVWVHAREADWLKDPALNGSDARIGFCPVPVTAPGPDRTVSGGDRFELLGQTVDVLDTPGHSPGHVAFRMGDVVFSGDAVFAGSIGRTDLPGGDYDQLLDSIRHTLLTLPDDTRLLPGHGPETSVGAEQKHNPFLQG